MTFPAPGVYREDQAVRRVTLTVDVPEILRQLEALGMPDTEIMQRCGLKSRSPLYAWRSGEKMPSLLPGLRLLLLHLEVCPRFSPLRIGIDGLSKRPVVTLRRPKRRRFVTQAAETVDEHALAELDRDQLTRAFSNADEQE
jgi:hypothetical protein